MAETEELVEELVLFQEAALQECCATSASLPPHFVWTQEAGSQQEHFLVTRIEQPPFARYDLQYEDGGQVSCALCPMGSVLLQQQRYFVYLLMEFIH